MDLKVFLGGCFTTILTSVDITLLNTKSADDHIEDSDDEDDCNGDVVEDGGGLVVLCVVYVQTSKHKKEDARQNLEKENLIIQNSKKEGF